jgi:hypothetical protein
VSWQDFRIGLFSHPRNPETDKKNIEKIWHRRDPNLRPTEFHLGKNSDNAIARFTRPSTGEPEWACPNCCLSRSLALLLHPGVCVVGRENWAEYIAGEVDGREWEFWIEWQWRARMRMCSFDRQFRSNYIKYRPHCPSRAFSIRHTFSRRIRAPSRQNRNAGQSGLLPGEHSQVRPVERRLNTCRVQRPR